MHRLVVLVLAFAVCAHGSPADRILGGSSTTLWSAPYQVSLQSTPGGHFCGGSIINHRWILTTAECANGRRLLPIQVVAGTNSLAFGRGVNIPASEVIIHPHWSALAPRRNDIALVRLMAPLFWTSRIQPITLPTSDFTEADYPAVLTGWGTNGTVILGTGELHETLQRITVNVIGQRSCLLRAVGATSKTICTETISGESGACDGDSGGPLLADGVQIGILSSATFPCASGRPDLYTRVWSYVDWINETIN